MKNRAKFLLVIMISLFGYKSFAQTIGIKGGLNLSNMIMKDDNGTYSDEFKMNPGFHIGIIMDIPFSNIISLETGLLLDTKGAKEKDDYNGVASTWKMNLYYLDIPVTFKALHELNSNVKLYGVIGPYIGIGLSGKMKSVVEYQGNKETDEEDIEWGNDENEDMLKRFDFGITFGGGVEISTFLIGISYDLGLANISTYTDYGSKINNRVLKFSFGYRFGNIN
jgi:hypothetical protein